MVAMTKHPVGNSNVSESVTVDLSPFLPYNCYCLTSVHQEGIRYVQYLSDIFEDEIFRFQDKGGGGEEKVMVTSVDLFHIFHNASGLGPIEYRSDGVTKNFFFAFQHF